MKGETFSTAGVIIFTFFREAFETLAGPSLPSTVPSPPHTDLLNVSAKALGAKKNWGVGGGRETGEGMCRGARERVGREKELIIQIQSLKGKCVFQAVKMINGCEQILTNALV